MNAMTAEDLQNFKITDLTERSLDISRSSERAHAILCATAYYWNNVDFVSDRDRLIADACWTFNVPATALKHVLGI